MGDYPDIYADGFSVSVGPFGVTVTLRRSEPTGEPGPHQDPAEIVGRIRLTPNLAKAIAAALNQMIDAAAQAQTDSETSISH